MDDRRSRINKTKSVFFNTLKVRVAMWHMEVRVGRMLKAGLSSWQNVPGAAGRSVGLSGGRLAGWTGCLVVVRTGWVAAGWAVEAPALQRRCKGRGSRSHSGAFRTMAFVADAGILLRCLHPGITPVVLGYRAAYFNK